ncbi:hypothetical protein [aff. Roholtiella sp. LEGE 12411]|uniref:hypothetical protein n=1 Tax=aff. Roholtiella sp. LEGE 12411 TaxID=1828822 RepID=UPI00187F838B|nr:hypothetical protein [aff. Roholtiella sp. LEGE 12411]MBE9039028.1 hypothetical protein [aff. Roholtiella sp. LEGE 12411]
MNKNFNKFAVLGSISARFYWDIRRYKNACLSGAASRKTKRQFKRIAARASRNFIKKDTREVIKDLLEL